MQTRMLATALLLVFSTASAADIIVELRDGTQIKSNRLKDPLTIRTKYGELAVPLEELDLVQFGFRISSDQENLIKGCIVKLGAVDYKEREEAFSELKKLGPTAYPYLYADKSPDKERSKRVDQLTTFMRDNYPAITLVTEFDDKIVAKEFTLKGQINNKKIEFNHQLIGNISVDIHNVKRIHSLFTKKMSIDSVGTWEDVGLTLLPGRVYSVSANGKVDLYQGSGQYISSPNGLLGAGYKDNFVCGGLLAKIDDGAAFFVGSYKEILGNGRLFLQINPCSWPNSNESGGYEIEVGVK